MKYNTIYMETWSRRLMTHHAHPLLTPQCIVQKISRRKYRCTPLIVNCATIVKRFARVERATESEQQVESRKFYSPSHTFLSFASPMGIEVRRRHWRTPSTRTFFRAPTPSDGKRPARCLIVARKRNMSPR